MLPPHLRLLAPSLLLALAGGCGAADPDLGTMRVPILVRDLVSEPPIWSGTVGAEPRAAVLSPGRSMWRDGADMPALVLGPPAEVTFRVDPGGPQRLRGRVGVDASAHAGLRPESPRAAIGFEVQVDGTLAFEHRIELTLEQTAGRFGTDWVDLAHAGADALGLRVTTGSVVTLRTRAYDAEGNAVDPGAELLAGFGGLRLERELDLPRRASSPGSPNIVLVVMDTLRVDRLSTYGYSRPTAPHLDALAAKGVLHTQAQATSSWTWPSTASILTGLQTPEHGVVGDGSSFLPRQLDTLAEVLRREGFTTAAWSGNPLVAPSRNFDQGFERFTVVPEGFRKSSEFFDEVTTWLAERGGERFFLYLHLVEPHGPLESLPASREALAAHVPADFGSRLLAAAKALGRGDALAPDATFDLAPFLTPQELGWTQDLYDACVHSGDTWVGELLATLEALALDDETLILFTSDHGEELLERGVLGHHHSLHQELTHVPLLVVGPGIPRGRRSSSLISNRLVAPALAALGGASLPGSDAALARLLGDEPAVEPVLFATEKGWWQGENGRRMLGVRDGDRVLHWVPKERKAPLTGPSDLREGEARLYDLVRDPFERLDLSGELPDEVRRLHALLSKRYEELEAHRPAATFGAGSATLEILRRVGYTGEDH